MSTDRSTPTPQLQLHSPLLREMPQPRIRWRRQRRWFLVFCDVVAVLMLAILFVAFRWGDENGPGRFLYELHDNVYLLLKGELIIRFIPDSLIGLGVVLSVLAFIVGSWLLGLTLVQRLHTYLVRAAINGGGLLRFTVTLGLRIMRLIRLEPHVIWHVVSSEHEKSLHLLGAQATGQADRRLYRRVRYLTHLMFRLHPLFRESPSRRADMVERWFHTYLLLVAYGDLNDDGLKQTLTDMETIFRSTVKQDAQNRIHPRQDYFRLEKLVAEIDDLLCIPLRQDTLSSQDAGRLNRVVDAVEVRREQMEHLYLQLQTELSSAQHNGSQRRQSEKRSVTVPLEEAAAAGRIAQDISLYIAVLRRQAAFAYAYLDSCESLFFLLQAVYPSFNLGTGQNSVYQIYGCLTGTAPAPISAAYPLLHAANIYRLLAQLGQADVANQHTTWATELLRGEASFMRESDFQFDQHQYQTLARLALHPVSDALVGDEGDDEIS